MKILFVDMHRAGRSPSQRFRYEQYLDFLTESNIEWEHSYLLDAKDDIVFYQPRNYFKKFMILLNSFRRRLKDVRRANRDIDIVFIQREAFMLGTTLFEKLFAKSKAKVIFDFDDAIWMHHESNSSASNKNLSWLKDPNKIKEIIALADLVIAGNEYLANYAKQFNVNVAIIPTTIDTQEYLPKKEKDYKRDKICIGWSGSRTTIDHFELAIPVLKDIKRKYGDSVTFKVIGDESYHNVDLDLRGNMWCKDTEIEDLLAIDIGIMPLPNDEWVKGKCGLKGLQYMALGVPTLMSPVGVNSKIIKDGENGFLPINQLNWVEKLSLLIESHLLRKQLGQNGLKTVERTYSVNSHKEKLLDLLCNI